MFDFNASLNDAVPVSPMLLSGHRKNEMLMDVICVVHFAVTTQIKFFECCV